MLSLSVYSNSSGHPNLTFLDNASSTTINNCLMYSYLNEDIFTEKAIDSNST